MEISKIISDILFSCGCCTDNALVVHNAPVDRLCTMRVGGRAAYMVVPPDVNVLCRLLSSLTQAGVPYLLLGAGSNVIPGDGHFDGVVVLTSKLQRIRTIGTKIKAECGAMLNALILSAAEQDLCCMERLYGIPGTVGGALKMNAGAHGTSIADWLVCATLFSPITGETCVFSKEELALSYRDSLLQHQTEWAVLDATFQATPMAHDRVKASVAAVVKARLRAQPIGLPSAGSVFRRPVEGEAWRLIDRCGLRGYRLGGAQVSPKHAGFIVNTGKASAGDVFHLVRHVQARVEEACGVHLVPEIEFFHMSEE
jgi:UDP-N-acetylmuramate dehydrogenase